MERQIVEVFLYEVLVRKRDYFFAWYCELTEVEKGSTLGAWAFERYCIFDRLLEEYKTKNK